MRQVNAVNGSQMVVKIGGSYYRRVKGMQGAEPAAIRLLFSQMKPSLFGDRFSGGAIWKVSAHNLQLFHHLKEFHQQNLKKSKIVYLHYLHYQIQY